MKCSGCSIVPDVCYIVGVRGGGGWRGGGALVKNGGGPDQSETASNGREHYGISSVAREAIPTTVHIGVIW